MSQDLKPLKLCPFCGAEAIATRYSGEAAIFCSECPASMGGEESRMTEDELAAAWNTRAQEPTS